MSLVAAVIGFRDWGLERLALSIRSIHESLQGIDHEVVVCDYGSEDCEGVERAVLAAGGRYVREETDGVWSRSRALNAAVRATASDIILATDADMLFTPAALRRVVENIQQYDQQVVILQCRDLPHTHDADAVARDGIDWDRFWAISCLRPRWGMGGLVGVRRSEWNRLRGWDERMHTYGGEDIDFARRCQRSGLRINWLDEPDVGMFHIWHPSTSVAAKRSAEAEAAVAHNRGILSTDETLVRNRVSHQYLPTDLPPIVTVVLRTTEHTDWTTDARRTLFTILTQTVTDIEVLLLEGPEELASLDPRVHALSVSPHDCVGRSAYTLVAEVGDLWVPNRLERLLDAATANTAIVADLGALEVLDDNGVGHRQPLTWDPYHAANTLIRTRLLAGVHHDTTWPEIGVAVAESAAPWSFVPQVGYGATVSAALEEQVGLERGQLVRDGIARLRTAGVDIGDPPPAPKPASFTSPLPEVGSHTSARLVGHRPGIMAAATELPSVVGGDRCHVQQVTDLDGVCLAVEVRLTDLDPTALLAALGVARTHGIGLVLAPEDEAPPTLASIIDDCELVHGDGKHGWWIVVSCPTPEDADRTVDRARGLAGVAVTLGRVLVTGAEARSIALIRTTSGSRDDSFGVACDLAVSGPVTIMTGRR